MEPADNSRFAAVAAGDRAALGTLLDEHRPHLLRMIDRDQRRIPDVFPNTKRDLAPTALRRLTMPS